MKNLSLLLTLLMTSSFAMASNSTINITRKFKVTCDFNKASPDKDGLGVMGKYAMTIDLDSSDVSIECLDEENCFPEMKTDKWELVMNSGGKTAGLMTGYTTSVEEYRSVKVPDATYLAIKGSNNDDTDGMIYLNFGDSISLDSDFKLPVNQGFRKATYQPSVYGTFSTAEDASEMPSFGKPVECAIEPLN